MACPLRWVENPRYRGLYLRREAQYLGDAIDKSEALYPKLGGRLVKTPRIVWSFPSGAQLWFNHCEHETDIKNYDSFEFSEVLFDELTHFTEKQYRGIRARLRGTDPALPYWSRAATNPGGDGHEWVFARFAPWLDPESAAPAAPGELRHFLGDDAVPQGTPLSLSRTFIPALLADNPHVDASYRAQLLDLDPVRRAQLERGDWLVRPAAGLYFKRAWMPTVEGLPPSADVVGRVRYWDRASTEGGGDWTAGVRMSRTRQGLYVVEDVVRVQKSPGGVEETIRATAERDDREAPGTILALEQDPGQAGKFEAAYYQREFAGRVIRIVPKRADKITAAGPFSAQASPPGGVGQGNVRVCRGAWNGAFYAELEAFPDGDKDDQVDAGSGAFSQLAAISLTPHRARTALAASRSIHG